MKGKAPAKINFMQNFFNNHVYWHELKKEGIKTNRECQMSNHYWFMKKNSVTECIAIL